MRPESLAYALVLLEEIAQGYDNGSYRVRALQHIKDSGFIITELPLWFSHTLTTPTMIDIVENALITYFAGKVDTGK